MNNLRFKASYIKRNRLKKLLDFRSAFNNVDIIKKITYLSLFLNENLKKLIAKNHLEKIKILEGNIKNIEETFNNIQDFDNYIDCIEIIDINKELQIYIKFLEKLQNKQDEYRYKKMIKKNLKIIKIIRYINRINLCKNILSECIFNNNRNTKNLNKIYSNAFFSDIYFSILILDLIKNSQILNNKIIISSNKLNYIKRYIIKSDKISKHTKQGLSEILKKNSVSKKYIIIRTNILEKITNYSENIAKSSKMIKKSYELISKESSDSTEKLYVIFYKILNKNKNKNKTFNLNILTVVQGIQEDSRTVKSNLSKYGVLTFDSILYLNKKSALITFKTHDGKKIIIKIEGENAAKREIKIYNYLSEFIPNLKKYPALLGTFLYNLDSKEKKIISFQNKNNYIKSETIKNDQNNYLHHVQSFKNTSQCIDFSESKGKKIIGSKSFSQKNSKTESTTSEIKFLNKNTSIIVSIITHIDGLTLRPFDSIKYMDDLNLSINYSDALLIIYNLSKILCLLDEDDIYWSDIKKRNLMITKGINGQPVPIFIDFGAFAKYTKYSQFSPGMATAERHFIRLQNKALRCQNLQTKLFSKVFLRFNGLNECVLLYIFAFTGLEAKYLDKNLNEAHVLKEYFETLKMISLQNLKKCPYAGKRLKEQLSEIYKILPNDSEKTKDHIIDFIRCALGQQIIFDAITDEISFNDKNYKIAVNTIKNKINSSKLLSKNLYELFKLTIFSNRNVLFDINIKDTKNLMTYKKFRDDVKIIYKKENKNLSSQKN